MSFMPRQSMTVPMTPSEAEPYRRLWQAVAVVAIVDAAKKAPTHAHGRERGIQHEMRYFRGVYWRRICDRAEVSLKPEKVEAFLRSDAALGTQSDIYSALGLAGGRK